MESTRLRPRATPWPAGPILAGACVLLLAACATGPAPAGPPGTPQNVTSVPGPGYVVVSWEHDGAGVSSFLVERTDGAVGSVARVAVAPSAVDDVDAEARSFVDLDVEPDVAYAYTVTAVGPEGPSEPVAAAGGTVTVAMGVDLMVGTNDRRYDDGTGTIFIVYYVFPRSLQDDPTATYHVTIEGPAGWNAGDAITFSLAAGGASRTEGWGFVSRNTVDAVAGAYTVTVDVARPAGTETFTASTELLEPGFQLGAPTDMAVTVGTDSVEAAWTPPAGTRSHIVSLWRGDYGSIVGTYAVIGGTAAHTFTGVALDDGLHQVEIAPVNVDLTTYPIRVEPFGIAYDARPFMVGDAVSPLCASADEVVDVADTALEAAVRAATGATVGPLTCSDLAVLTSLEVRDTGITSLDGIEYANHLTFLGLSGNDVSNLAPLSGLVGLTGLNLDLNPIPGIDALADLVNLRYLSIGGTPTSDLTVVAGMAELELLYAWETLPTDLDALAGLANLKLLDVGSGQVTDIGAVAQLPSLERLLLGSNPIADLTPLDGLTGLRELDLSGVGVADASFLGVYTQLEFLRLDDNELTSITPLAQNLALAHAVVQVRNNLLDLTDQAVLDDIAALIARGVDLAYEPQRTE